MSDQATKKVCLVIGVGDGVGAAIAKAFALDGFETVIGLTTPFDPALLASLEEQGMTAGVNPPFRFSLGERSSLDAKKRNMEDFAKRFIVNRPD